MDIFKKLKKEKVFRKLLDFGLRCSFCVYCVKKSAFVLTVLSLLLCGGCRSVYLFGLHLSRDFDEDEYEEFVMQIPHTDAYTWILSDSGQYYKTTKLASLQNGEVNLTPMHPPTAVDKDFSQFIKVLFFKNALLTSSNAIYNYAPKSFIPEYDTAMQKRFSVFPPQSFIVVDTLQLGLSQFSAIYPKIGQVSPKKYTVLIFWTLISKKLSASAITTVQEYITSFGKDEDTAIILINSDRFWSSYWDGPKCDGPGPRRSP